MPRNQNQIIPLLGAIGLLVAVIVVIASQVIRLPPQSGLGQVISAQNISSLQIVKVMKQDNPITALAIGPSGNFVAFGTSGINPVVGLWYYKTDEAPRIFTGLQNDVSNIAIDPQETYLAVGNRIPGPASLINIKAWKTIYTLQNNSDLPGFFHQFAINRDDSLLAAASMGIDKDNNYSAYGLVQLWDAQSGKEIKEFKDGDNALSTISFSPDGSQILTGSSALDSVFSQTSSPVPLHLWDVKSGQMIGAFNGHTSTITSIAFSPKGKIAASGSYDSQTIIWDLTTQKALFSLKMPSAVNNIAFSPFGTLLISVGDFASLQIWDMQSSRLLSSYSLPGSETSPLISTPMYYSAVIFSPDGKAIFVTDQDRSLYMLVVPN